MSGGGGDSSSGGEGGFTGGGFDPSISDPGVPGAPAVTDGDSRDVVTTGSLQLVVEDPIGSADAVSALVISTGGRLDSVSQYPKSPYQPASASLLARIPESKLDQALIDLKKLGTVQSLSTNSTDVTQQTTDYSVRVANLEAAVDRLRALLAQATDTSDLIEIETALTSRQGDLESMKAQRDALAEQVAFATIAITLSSPSQVAPATPGTFWDGLVAGWNSLVAALSGLLIVAGAVIPWLAFLGILVIIVLVIVRLARRGRRRPAAPPSATAEPEKVDSPA